MSANAPKRPSTKRSRHTQILPITQKRTLAPHENGEPTPFPALSECCRDVTGLPHLRELLCIVQCPGMRRVPWCYKFPGNREVTHPPFPSSAPPYFLHALHTGCLRGRPTR